MNIRQIRELALIIRQNDLSALEVTEGDLHIRMEREITAESVSVAAAPPFVASVENADTPPVDPGVDFNDVVEIKSPMVGVFYAAPAPDAPPFTEVGRQVKKGDVLCIIEAMKLMNEITAEAEGKVVDICVSNGDVVEYGQTLFKLY